MPVVKITTDFIEHHLTCIDGKIKTEWCCSSKSGFYIAVQQTSQGTGTYYLRYKNADGKTCHQKIGRTDSMNLGDARVRVTQLKSEIAAGNDPRAKALAKKAVPTFAEFFTEQYLPHAKSRKRSWNKDESMFRVRLKDTFGKKRLNQISRREVVSFHTRLLEVDGLSPASCDHHLKLMRRMFNLAVEWEMLEKNPLTRIALYKEDNKVENYLDEVQLQRLLKVLNNQKGTRLYVTALVARMLLASTVRLNECLNARWIDINRETNSWIIRAETAKGKRVRSVPLNSAAISLLDELDTEGKFEYLFISPRTGSRVKSVHTGWDTIRKQAGLPKLRLHDLRHSGASYMVQSNVSLYIVSKILGHESIITSERYSHLNKKALLAASENISNSMNAAAEVSL